MRTVTKRAVQGAVAAALAFGGIAVSAGSAHAGSNSWWAGHNYWLTNDITANCVDDSAQYGLRDYECNADSYYSGYQKWHVLQVDGNGYAQLQNDNTGLCMDSSPQYGLRDYSCNQSSFNGGW